MNKYNIPEDSLNQLTLDGNLNLLEEILKIYKEKPTIIVSTLLETVKSLRRDGKSVENLTDSHFIQVFTLLEQKKIAKEAIEDILSVIAENPDSKIEDIIKEMDITTIGKEELQNIVKKIIPEFTAMIKERQMGAIGPIMGVVMNEVRGKIDGKIVSQVVRAEIMNIAKKEEK
jgi:glutamyl-tRNA(Gln) amidotransferase subunit E